MVGDMLISFLILGLVPAVLVAGMVMFEFVLILFSAQRRRALRREILRGGRWRTILAILADRDGKRAQRPGLKYRNMPVEGENPPQKEPERQYVGW